MIEADRISVTLNTTGVTQTIALDILNAFGRIELTTGLLHKTKFYCVYGKIIFLINYLLVEEDYELSKSTSHVPSVPLTLECIKVLL